MNSFYSHIYLLSQTFLSNNLNTNDFSFKIIRLNKRPKKLKQDEVNFLFYIKAKF